MTADGGPGAVGTRIVLRPLATPLPRGSSPEKTVLLLGRRGPGRAAMAGEGPLAPEKLAEEAGVRPQL